MPAIPSMVSRPHVEPPSQYRDHRRRIWYVSEVARFKVVSAAIDGPNHVLVIRFEREGEERFARWMGGEDWREPDTLHRLFAEAEPVESGKQKRTPAIPRTSDDTGVGPAPPETVALWVELVATMGPDELADFEERTFRQWDRSSLGDVRRAIERRRGELEV
jgi:hypothetical protein